MGSSVLSHVMSVSIASPRFLTSMSSGRLQRSYLKKWGRMHHYRLPGGYVDTSRCYCSVSVSQSDISEKASTSVKKRVVSGVQPTGSLHLGNYLGAIKNWILLQNTYETFFFIVDLHAVNGGCYIGGARNLRNITVKITLEYDVKQLATATKSTAAIYMACGVDTTKASVFVQSHVRAHAELMWLLSSVTPIGRLNRMIQFKEKSRKASDLVPVGEDQKQHLELTRELAERVNYMYGRKWKKMGGRSSAIFKVPESLIPPAGARVMSLTDGLSKMSKSDPSDQSRINLLDPKDVIANKIKRCKTDSFPGLEFGNPDRPECNNLLSIYQLVSGRTKEVGSGIHITTFFFS
ncbi:tryptophan--tRNA ligase, chloroplastic/mitochondrial-like isoform X3 [Macadamia integrifolia]|uniref:tryptophan--tRNA ligase, chloroplastic/mitochondrial-like isoform X3 n=1 Tax=Macadamia integrifolia TaxID=60698 RepID=UPI001C4ECB6F|nr:tryptophan--tRNA ligase, chloroplastic/mitochondrial-like isoform X3 [Macadamia integrifolia]